MNKSIYQQIADLLNEQNQLSEKVNSMDVLENLHQYVTITDPQDSTRLIAVARVRRTSWYMAEISHISVISEFQGKGYGRGILTLAELRAYELDNINFLTATIRLGNESSDAIFQRKGWLEAKKFVNHKTGNSVKIMVK